MNMIYKQTFFKWSLTVLKIKYILRSIPNIAIIFQLTHASKQ